MHNPPPPIKDELQRYFDKFFNILHKLTPHRKPVDKTVARFADFNARLMAAAIDTLLIVFILSPLMAMLTRFIYSGVDLNLMMHEIEADPSAHRAEELFIASGFWIKWLLNNVLQIAILGTVVLFFWFRYSATPGKIVMRMVILDEQTGGQPTRLQFIIRFLGYFVSFLPLFMGFMWVGLNKKKKAWHDMMAGTVVIIKPKRIKDKKVSSTDQSADRLDSPAPAAAE